MIKLRDVKYIIIPIIMIALMSTFAGVAHKSFDYGFSVFMMLMLMWGFGGYCWGSHIREDYNKD